MAPFGASRAGLMSVAKDDIPDSAISQYDASDSDTVVTSNGTVVEWQDKIGDNDLTGSFSSVEDGAVNGLDALLSDGVDDEMDVAYSQSVEPPFTTIFVFEQVSDTDQGTLLSNVGDRQYYANRDDDRWLFQIDDFDNISHPSGTNETFIHTVIWDSTMEFYQNGTFVGNPDVNAIGLDGLAVAYRPDEDDRHHNLRNCEIRVYDSGLDSETRESEESGLADKWGVSI